MANTVDDRYLKIDGTVQVERGAVVGYVPARKIETFELSIGAGAVIRTGTVIYAGSRIGASLATGHNVVIREENSIGERLQIWSNSVLDYGCRIGNGVRIHCNCYVAQFSEIEDEAFLAPGVMIANDLYPGSNVSARRMRGPRILRGAQVGVNCTILPYITIGEGSVIGAGSVVTRDVPDGTIAYGSPARPQGTRARLTERDIERIVSARAKANPSGG